MLDTATMILYSNVSSLNEIRYILLLTTSSLIIIFTSLRVYTGLVLYARYSDDGPLQQCLITNEIRYIIKQTISSLILIFTSLLVYTGLVLYARYSDDDPLQQCFITKRDQVYPLANNIIPHYNIYVTACVYRSYIACSIQRQ